MLQAGSVDPVSSVRFSTSVRGAAPRATQRRVPPGMPTKAEPRRDRSKPEEQDTNRPWPLGPGNPRAPRGLRWALVAQRRWSPKYPRPASRNPCDGCAERSAPLSEDSVIESSYYVDIVSVASSSVR